MLSLASLVALSVLLITSNVVADVLPSPVLLTRTTAAEVSNPFVTQFPAGVILTIAAQSQAAFVQLVNIDDGVDQPCVLQGSGENVQMLTTTPNAGADSCNFDGTSAVNPLQFSFLFQFSESGASGTFSNSRVQAPTVAGSVPIVDIITSEDDTDDDNNDTILTIAIYDPNTVITTTSPPIPPPTALPEALMSQGGLSVSNNGIDISIGPFTGSSTTSDFVVHTPAWREITGRVIDHKTPGNWRNYLVMQFILSGSTTPGMEKATLMMSAMVPYTDTRPTGNVSANWNTITRA